MKYVDQQDFLQEFWTDDIPSDGSRIDRAIDRSEALVETYLRASSMEVPVTNADVIRDIKGPCLDIARYLLWSDQPSEVMGGATKMYWHFWIPWPPAKSSWSAKTASPATALPISKL